MKRETRVDFWLMDKNSLRAASDDSSNDSSNDPSDDSSNNSAQISSPDWVYRLSSNLALLEGVIVASLGVFLIVNSLFSEIVERDAWIAEIVFAAVGAAGLILASRGLRNRKNWGRAPVVLANLIAIPVAYYLVTSDRIILGIILGMISVPALLSTWFSIPDSANNE